VLIEELPIQACLDLLSRVRSCRLACAQQCQPYVVPFYFHYHYECLYSFSTVGQKIEWMRANPKVCVEADEVKSAHQWTSVVAYGRYEELLDTAEWRSERERAWKLLRQHAMWWEPGYVKTIVHGTERSLAAVFYRIHLDRVTGRHATLERAVPADTGLPAIEVVEGGRLQRILRLVQGRLRQ
jgi:uncharacterized protein